MSRTSLSSNLLNTTIIISSLGYFVDIFDTVLFGMLRVQSLHDMGYSQELIEGYGRMIDNWQLFGIIIGGVLWGIYGDKAGRLKVLYGSIIIYSGANLASGMVNDAYWYSLVRFIAGLGLAGELGASITLVNEVMDKKRRGIATRTGSLPGRHG